MPMTIPLSRGMHALVDAQNFQELSKFKWYALKVGRRFYAARDEGSLCILMHRAIAGTPKGLDTDHIDGNGLNNRNYNLRIATRKQNLSGFQRKASGKTSIYRGVRWHRQRKRWTAQLKQFGIATYLGIFDSEEDAARAYDVAALKHFGEFACPNFRPATSESSSSTAPPPVTVPT